MTDRLTLEQMRPGLRVRCVQWDHFLSSTPGVPGDRIHEGCEYVVERIQGLSIYLHGVRGHGLCAGCFIPASPALPAMTAELVAALETWAASGKTRYLCLHDFLLLTAIERTPGLLPAPPSTAPLPAMWCGADAFEGEG